MEKNCGKQQLLNDIQEVYDSGRLKPIQGTFRNPDSNCGCALTAGYIAKGYKIGDFSNSVEEVVKREYNLPSAYTIGIIAGFDAFDFYHENDESSEEYLEGFRDGKMLQNKYFPKIEESYEQSTIPF